MLQLRQDGFVVVGGGVDVGSYTYDLEKQMITQYDISIPSCRE